VLLWTDTFWRLRRIVLGLGIATLIGLAVGVANGPIPYIRASFAPFISVIAVIPPMAALPVLFIVLGRDETSKATLIVIDITPFLMRNPALRIEELPIEQLIKAQTNLPNVPAVSLVQIGIGGWHVPREAVAQIRARNTNLLTMRDVEELGIGKTAEIALELAWKNVDAVSMSFDIGCVDCGSGTGWPEPGGFLPREVLRLIALIDAEGLCGVEVVEVSPPYATSDISSLLGVRVIVAVLFTLVAHGKLGAHRAMIDKPVRH